MRASAALLAAAAIAAPLEGQLTGAGHQLLDATLLGATIQAGDELGFAFAVGDFDGNTYDDLAIGLPGRTVGGLADAGAVIVVYGSLTGLNGAGALPPLLIHQDVTNVLETAEAGDRFGAALVAGDFDNSGTDDLAVGVPFEDLEAAPVVVDAGLVQVFYSTFSGIDPANDEIWNQESFAGLSVNETGDQFGAMLISCTGGFFGDEYEDLAIGIPGDNFMSLNDSGSLYSVYGSGTGLTTTGATQNGSGFATPPAAGDRTGSSAACAVFSASGVVFVVGSPFAEADGVENSAGIVRVASSSSSPYEIASPYGGSRLGTAVAITPLLDDVSYEVYGGMPGFDAGGQNESGAVVLGGGLAIIAQGALGLGETAEPLDHLGDVLAVGDWNDDGLPDVAFGVPGEDLRDADADPALDAGMVHVLFNQSRYVGTAAAQIWNWDEPAIYLGALSDDKFGAALAAGDFDGDGVDDLAIGAPGAYWNSVENGLVEILYGERKLIFADNFEISETDPWSFTSP